MLSNSFIKQFKLLLLLLCILSYRTNENDVTKRHSVDDQQASQDSHEEQIVSEQNKLSQSTSISENNDSKKSNLTNKDKTSKAQTHLTETMFKDVQNLMGSEMEDLICSLINKTRDIKSSSALARDLKMYSGSIHSNTSCAQ